MVSAKIGKLANNQVNYPNACWQYMYTLFNGGLMLMIGYGIVFIIFDKIFLKTTSGYSYKQNVSI